MLEHCLSQYDERREHTTLRSSPYLTQSPTAFAPSQIIPLGYLEVAVYYP